MKLTKNFQLSEFACHDGTLVPEHLIPNVKKLAKNLQVLRNELGESITINSGFRSKSWNTKVGGKPQSAHLEGMASDITVRSLTPKQLHTKILQLIKSGEMEDGGLGLYPSFVHYDIGNPRRW